MEALNAPLVAGFCLAFAVWVLTFLYLDVRAGKIMPWLQWRIIELMNRKYRGDQRIGKSEHPNKFALTFVVTTALGAASAFFGIFGMFGLF